MNGLGPKTYTFFSTGFPVIFPVTVNDNVHVMSRTSKLPVFKNPQKLHFCNAFMLLLTPVIRMDFDLLRTEQIET